MEGEDEVVFKKEKQFLKVMDTIKNAVSLGITPDTASTQQILNILEAKGKLPGTKVQLRPFNDKTDPKTLKTQIIVKWGGLFTHGGFHHSQDLGLNLRTDLNIINKGLIQDIQVLSSSERRVIGIIALYIS